MLKNNIDSTYLTPDFSLKPSLVCDMFGTLHSLGWLRLKAICSMEHILNMKILYIKYENIIFCVAR